MILGVLFPLSPLAASPTEDLFQAIMAGNVAAAKKALAAKADVNARGSGGTTPLILAFSMNRKNPAILKLILEARPRPDLNARNEAGLTALIAAVENLDTEGSPTGFAELLIKAGAKVNLQDNEGRSAWYLAVLKAALPLMALLEKAGADINVQDSFGQTPWMRLAGSMGVSPRMRSTWLDMIRASRSDFNLADREGHTLLHHAVLVGSLPMVQAVLSRKPLVDAKDHLGRTALHGAVSGSQDIGPMTDLLLKAGASTDIQDHEGTTALMLSVRHGDRDALELLLRAGASTALRDKEGRDVMDWAKARGDLLIIRRLEEAGMKSGLDTRLSDDDFLLNPDGTFLRYDLFRQAIEAGDLATVRKHVGLGASLSISLEGRTPLALAREKGWQELVDWLVAQGAPETIQKKKLP